MSVHDATFRLLGTKPSTSSLAKEQLDAAERRLGVTMPLSIREWYERESAIRILAENSNDDPPIDVSKFALTQWHSHTLLPIRHENLGVCTWAVNFNGSDDPAVLVDVDTDGTQWNVQSNSFYSCVWDYKVVLRQPVLAEAKNCELTDAALETLAAKLKPELRTHGWPGSTQFRFRGSRYGILIWSGEHGSDWFVGAPDSASLPRALCDVWEIDSVGQSFYELSDIAGDVLDELRQRQ
jgi:hypothetical protein